MPHITSQIAVGGPLLDFRIGVSAPRAIVLKAQKKPIPPEVTLRGLIDTGASGTCIDPACLTLLGLSPTGQTKILTPSTGTTHHLCNQFDISLTILHPDLSLVLRAVPVIESNLANQGFQALIGRDILAKCLFVYNGTEETFSLAF